MPMGGVEWAEPSDTVEMVWGVTADLASAARSPLSSPFLHHKVTDCSFLGSVKGQGLFSEEKEKVTTRASF
jgi:hypothetical protein